MRFTIKACAVAAALVMAGSVGVAQAQDCGLTSIDPTCPPRTPTIPENPYSAENISNPYSAYNMSHPESPTSALSINNPINPASINNPTNPNNPSNLSNPNNPINRARQSESDRFFSNPHFDLLWFTQGDTPNVYWKVDGVQQRCKLNVDCPRFIYAALRRPLPAQAIGEVSEPVSPKHHRAHKRHREQG